MSAVSRVAVNHDGKGCSAPDPLVWDHGGQRKVRRTDIRVNVDVASLPGPRVELSVLISLPGLTVLVSFASFTAFLGTLHWPVCSEEMGHFGVSYLELLILFGAMEWTLVAQ